MTNNRTLVLLANHVVGELGEGGGGGAIMQPLESGDFVLRVCHKLGLTGSGGSIENPQHYTTRPCNILFQIVPVYSFFKE